MKRKKLALGMALMFGMSFLFGCANEKAVTTKESDKLNIITTVFAPYDFARQVTGEHAQVTMLVPPAAEGHSYEPTPQDIIKIQNCDVFIYGGGESEEWVTDILASIGNDNIQVIKMLDCVDAVEEEIIEGMEAEEHEHDEEEHDHDEEEIEYDEHVWTSPKNAIKIVNAIEEVVSGVDAENKSSYKANAKAYTTQLEALDTKFQEVVDEAVRKEVIFADRFPLRYFVEAYGLKYYAAFPGCSTETEPSAATVAFLIDKVKEDKIPVVFHIELSNEKMADTICEATGAKKLLFSACHNVTKADFENGITYLEIMNQNVETLKEALQ